LPMRAEVDWPPKKTKEWRAFQALLRAVDRDDLRSVRKMVKEGVDVDGKKAGDDFVPSNRPLMRAARKGNLQMVKLLLKAGALPDWCCCSCVTALHEAVEQGHADVVNTLLKAGADPSIPFAGEIPTLDLAKKTGNARIINLVQERLAEVKRLEPRSPDGGVEQGVGPDDRSPSAPARRSTP